MGKTNNELITFENTDYKLEITPAQVNFKGYQDLKDRMIKEAGGWDKHVITADSYSADKKTRAELNRFKKELDKRRLEIVRKASEPIDKFNAELKDLAGIAKNAADHIGEGLKYFDDKARQDKHQQNLRLLGDIAKEYGVSLQKLDYQDKWDNKSTGWSSIEGDARKQFEVIKSDEDIRHENIKVIQERAEGFTNPTMSAAPYIELLDNLTLSTILAEMDNDHEQLVKQNKVRSEAQKKAMNNVELQGNKFINAETGEVVDEVYSMTLKFKCTEKQFVALSEYIKEQGLICEKVSE